MSSLTSFQIKSHKGPYQVDFIYNEFKTKIEQVTKQKNIFIIIDKNVSEIYFNQLKNILENTPHLVIEANEDNKDLQRFTEYAVKLTESHVRRNYTLVAIGGGIIQDITCFLAATLFRGLDWIFFPTTLLAQADSCIGSKSSINVGGVKNLMGTFTPPQQIYIDTFFLKTLSQIDFRSGIGEMIKVHGIAGIKLMKDFSDQFDLMLNDQKTFDFFLHQSLMIKKDLIEIDEFDQGPRLVMNYGHTFGHAIESASHYHIAHGLAVTLGQAMACEFSYKLNQISKPTLEVVKKVFFKNLEVLSYKKIDSKLFFNAIKKDKKNIGTKIALILPQNDEFKIKKQDVECDDFFINFCNDFFKQEGFNAEY